MIDQTLALKLLILSLAIQLPASAKETEHFHPEAYNELLKNMDLLAPGNPLGHSTLEFGAPCLKVNPKACKGFPEIGCVWVEDNIFVCRCDFIHSWNETAGLCIPNVFAPCSLPYPPFNASIKCGLNMECAPDFLAKDTTSKICRCKKGYKISYNEEKLPAYCVVDDQFAEDGKDEEGDVAPANKSQTNKLNKEMLILFNAVLLLYSFVFARSNALNHK